MSTKYSQYYEHESLDAANTVMVESKLASCKKKQLQLCAKHKRFSVTIIS
jgi:hypothetical protein